MPNPKDLVGQRVSKKIVSERRPFKPHEQGASIPKVCAEGSFDVGTVSSSEQEGCLYVIWSQGLDWRKPVQ